MRSTVSLFRGQQQRRQVVGCCCATIYIVLKNYSNFSDTLSYLYLSLAWEDKCPQPQSILPVMATVWAGIQAEDLECPVCFSIPRELPIPSCSAGHIVCKSCRVEVIH